MLDPSGQVIYKCTEDAQYVYKGMYISNSNLLKRMLSQKLSDKDDFVHTPVTAFCQTLPGMRGSASFQIEIEWQ